MAANLTVRGNGQVEAAFSEVGGAAWHGLGTMLPEGLGADEWWQASGCDWDVIQRAVAMATPEQVETPEGAVTVDRYHRQDGYRFNVRGDTGAVLGLVSDKYCVVQNREAFQFMDGLADDGVAFESAFSLSGGKTVVVTARMPQVDTIVEGDDVMRYILMGLSHDGSSGIRFGVTPIRVVCWNTYSAAIRDRKNVRELSMPHTGNIRDRLQQARELVADAGQAFSLYAEQGRQLTAARWSDEQWTEFLNIMCPMPLVNDPDYTPSRAAAILTTRQAIERNYRVDSRQQIAGVAGSAWAAFNAVTQHVDHLPRRGADRTRKAEARFNVTQYGPGRDQKRRAFEAACNVSGFKALV